MSEDSSPLLGGGASTSRGRAALRGLGALALAGAVLLISRAPAAVEMPTWLALAGGSAALLFLRHRHGPDGAPWRSIAAGLALWALADVLWTWDLLALAGDGLSVGPADVAYLAGYAALAHGLWRRAPAVDDRDRVGALLDTALVVLIAGYFVVELVLVPTLGDLSLAGWERWSLGVYPVLDLALIGLALRSLFAHRRSPGAVLLLAGLTATLVADVAYLQRLAADVYDEAWWLDALWLVAYPLLAAAGLRAARLAGDRGSTPSRVGESFLGRIAVVGTAVVVAPPLAIRHAAVQGDWTALTAVASVLVPLLIIARLAHAVHDETRSQQEARRSREHTASVLQLSWDLVTVHGPDGRVLHASPAAHRMLGRAPHEVVGIDPLTLVHPDDRERVRAMLAGLLGGDGGPRTVEYRARRADASWITAESIGVCTAAEDGRPAVVVTTRDITERQRDAEELRFQAQLLEAVGEAVVATDLEGAITYWNPAAEALFGWCAREVLGRPVGDVLVGDDPDALLAALEVAARLHAGESYTGVVRRRHRDGTMIPTLFTGRPHRDAHGRQIGVLGSCTDISELEAARAELERRAAQQAAVARLGTDALRASSFEEVGRLAARTIQVTLEGVEASYVLPDAPLQRRPHETSVAIPLGGPDAPYGRLRILGDAPLSASDHHFLDSVANVVVAAADQHAVQRELDHLALHNPVTGLPNRALLLDRIDYLRASLPSGQRFAVLCLDLDGFKHVNDALGHRLGDQLLCTVAERLQAVVRPEDTVAHFGGDEFGVLCHRVGSDEEAASVATRLRDALGDAFDLEGSPVLVTTSIGAALGGAPTDGHRLLQEADAALYRAKEQGGNRVEHYDATLQRRAQRRLQVVSGLRSAIDRGEIEVRYQPLVELATGRIAAVEALARWGTGSRTVSPGEFIPVAEETGLIVPLGRHVLTRACRDAQDWNERLGVPLVVSVNVSPRELLEGGLVASVRDVLATSGLAAEHLTLEVTESAFIGDPEVAREALQQLRDLGVRLAIDDFGTGYSSLTHLRQLPFDVIKIDRSFVSGVSTDPHDLAIVSSSMELAQQFGLLSVAEGVETPEQLAVVSSLGGQLGQGFLWSPAVTAAELTELLASSPTDPTWPRAPHET